MIRLENVCFAYEKEIALRYVDLHINRGDSIVIQGPNGCGKSTLIKLLNGIIFPSEGKYFYQGHEINEKALKNSQFAKWFHQQMGYVFQNADAQLFCGSVEEEIAFRCALRGGLCTFICCLTQIFVRIHESLSISLTDI